MLRDHLLASFNCAASACPPPDVGVSRTATSWRRLATFFPLVTPAPPLPPRSCALPRSSRKRKPKVFETGGQSALGGIDFNDFSVQILRHAAGTRVVKSRSSRVRGRPEWNRATISAPARISRLAGSGPANIMAQCRNFRLDARS